MLAANIQELAMSSSSRLRGSILSAVIGAIIASAAHAAPGFQVYVSNEKSGDVTVIDGADFSVLATIAVGKRPRGIHASPDGKTVYVALSGTPVKAPPSLDAKGNPVFEKKKGKDDDDDDDAGADKSADGVGVIDVAKKKLIGKINAGSDPEEFDLSKDGKKIYISNEDVKTASIVNIATNKVEHIIPIGLEPEGVTTTLDGKHFYVTCEAGGDIYVIDAGSAAVSSHFKIEGRPRSVGFLANSPIAFIPSESAGQLNVIDSANVKVVKTITLPEGSRPMQARVSSDDKKLYVTNGRAGNILVFDTKTYELLDTIKVGPRPWGMGLSPDGKMLFVANGPSNDISVVDLTAGKEIKRVKAGSSPWGLTIVTVQ
jgi:YVTN family beta-propeller protein